MMAMIAFLPLSDGLKAILIIKTSDWADPGGNRTEQNPMSPSAFVAGDLNAPWCDFDGTSKPRHCGCLVRLYPGRVCAGPGNHMRHAGHLAACLAASLGAALYSGAVLERRMCQTATRALRLASLPKSGGP